MDKIQHQEKRVTTEEIKKSLAEFYTVSSLPCVLKDHPTGAYAPKGWMYYSRKPWVFDIRKAKVYRNSAGAKNALRGSRTPAKVLEFHKEMKKKYGSGEL